MLPRLDAGPPAAARPHKILFVFGTRPEAIKLCPVALLFKNRTEFEVSVCVTAQHRALLDQVLSAFEITPDIDLDLMLPDQTLSQSTSRILGALEPVLKAARPDMVLVQGDTTTTLCGGLAAFYERIPVGHVEAGLRTGDLGRPFPEEMNRVVVSRLAALHFAPTEWAASNLRSEGVAAERIFVTGNTGVDAVLRVRERLDRGQLRGRDWPELDGGRKLVVVTAHRRESFGPGFERICAAIAELAERSDVQIVCPVHPNPSVRGPVLERLGGCANVILVDPLDYVSFVDLVRRASILITDSGGIQEEGPPLGKPVLVLREKTERPEAVSAGTVKLVGTERNRILGEANRLLDDPEEYRRMSRVHNPYGDGCAGARIADAILSFLKGNGN